MNANDLLVTRTRKFEVNLANICPSHLEQSTSSLPLPAIIPPNVINLLLSNDSEAVQKSLSSLRLFLICSPLFLRTVFQLAYQLLLFVFVLFFFLLCRSPRLGKAAVRG